MKWAKRHKLASTLVLSGVVGFGLLWSVATLIGDEIADPVTPVASVAETISTSAIYNDVNAARVSAGVAALSLNPVAIQAAEQKCQDMVANDYYDHINPKTGSHGYAYAEALLPSGVLFNENLNEANLKTNQAWVDDWINSPDHKATMLEPKFTDTGLAICHRASQPSDSLIVVQEFIAIP